MLKPSKPIGSVSDFVERVLEWTRDGKKPVAFRGQSFWDWKSEPKLFRSDVGLYDHEKNAVRDLVSIHPQEFREDETMFDRLVRMQHFNLPTRLLDVTTNPLVALYFATDLVKVEGKEQDGKVQAFFIPEVRQRYYDSDRVSCVANLANLNAQEKKSLSTAMRLPKDKFNKSPPVKRLLWFVRIEKPHFEPDIEPSDLRLPVYVKPKMSNRRIIAQSGAFVIFGSRRTATLGNDQDLRVSRILVSADKKMLIREQLEKLGINASTLFPEIDKAADFIVRHYSRV